MDWKWMKTASNSANRKMEEEMLSFMSLITSPDNNQPNPNKAQTSKGKKVVNDNLPIFDGNDAVGWISKAEVFFQAHSTPLQLKVPLAMSCMKGTTLYWFLFVRKLDPELTWEKFKPLLLKRYGGGASAATGRGEDPGRGVECFLRLIAVKQTGSVAEYIDEFVMQAVEVSGLTDEQYVGIFLNGLKGDVQRLVKLKSLNDIEETMSLALEVEQNLAGYGPLIGPETRIEGFPYSLIEDDEDEDDDLDPIQQLALMRYATGAGLDGSGAETPLDDPRLKWFMKLSLKIERGGPCITFKGVMVEGQLAIVISPYTSHNFISNDAVRKLHLQVQPTVEFGVRVNGGPVIRSKGVCRNLKVKLGSVPVPVVADFYKFQLDEGVDAVLGNAWLGTLSRFQTFVKQGRFAVTFLHQGTRVVLQTEG